MTMRQKKSSVIVADVMSPGVKSIAPDATIAAAKALMSRERVHHLAVMRQGNLMGILSARDLARRRSGSRPQTVADVMTRHVLAVDRRQPLSRAAHTMRGRSIGCLLVRDRGGICGIVTTADLMNHIRIFGLRPNRAKAGAALHHRIPHRPRPRSDGVW